MVSVDVKEALFSLHNDTEHVRYLPLSLQGQLNSFRYFLGDLEILLIFFERL